MDWLLSYLAIGATVGVFAGLLGIGGGAIMVPLLVMVFEAQGLPRTHILHLAVGTAMATILFTSISSVRAHAARGALRWDIAWAITPGLLLGALAGAGIAGLISTSVFAAVFTVFVFAAATNILLDRKPAPGRQLPGRLGMFAAGSLIGVISSMAAVGGAVLSIPFLLYCNVPVIQTIGTASIIGFPIAFAGGLGFVLTGLAQPGLPPWSLGYVYLPALGGIIVASMLTAPLGAALAHRLPTKKLRQIFACLLYLLATKMLIDLW